MILSLVGDNFYLLAVQFLAFRLTSSPLTMSTVLLLAAVPRAGLMVVGGALSDRRSPRDILLSTAGTRAIVLAVIGVLAISGDLRVWHLYATALIFGTSDALALPAGSRYLPSLVPSHGILRASAFLQATAGTFTLIGLAPVGAVVTIFGAGPSLLAGAGCFLLVAAAVVGLTDPGTADSTERHSMRRSITDGIAYLRGAEALRRTILIGILFNFCLEGPIAVGLPYLASARFQSPTAFGAMLSTIAAGGILGSMISHLLAPLPIRLVAAGGLVLCGVSFSIVGAFHMLLPNCIALFFAGAAAETINLLMIARVQRRVDPTYRGRVMSLVMFGSVGLNPLSIGAAGILSDWTPALLFTVAGAGIVLVGALALTALSLRDWNDEDHLARQP